MVSPIPSYQVCGRKFPSIDLQDQPDGGKPYASGMKTLLPIRKYGQYHCPIARPILFWLNGRSVEEIDVTLSSRVQS